MSLTTTKTAAGGAVGEVEAGGTGTGTAASSSTTNERFDNGLRDRVGVGGGGDGVGDNNNTSNMFTKLTFVEIYLRIWEIYKLRLGGFILIALLIYIVGWICSILLSLMLYNDDLRIDGFSISYTPILEMFRVKNESNEDDDQGYNQYGSNNGNGGNHILVSSTQTFFYLAECFIYYVFCCLAHGVSIWYTLHLYYEQYPHPYDSFYKAYTKWTSLVACTFLISMIYGIPIFLLFVILYNSNHFTYITLLQLLFLSTCWSIFISILTYVTYPIIIVESSNSSHSQTIGCSNGFHIAWNSIKRSLQLTEGYKCDIFGIILVWKIFQFILSLTVATLSQQLWLSLDSYEISLMISKSLDTIFGILILSINPM